MLSPLPRSVECSNGFIFLVYLPHQFSTHAHLFASGDDEPPQLRMVTALLCLTFITALVALLSEYLVDAIDGFTEQVHDKEGIRSTTLMLASITRLLVIGCLPCGGHHSVF